MLVLQWHTTVSAADEKWTEDVFNKVFDGKPFDQLTLRDFGTQFIKILSDVDPDPSKRTFGK